MSLLLAGSACYYRRLESMCLKTLILILIQNRKCWFFKCTISIKKKSALCSLLIPIGVQGCQENQCSARCFVLCASIYQKFRCSINWDWIKSKGFIKKQREEIQVWILGILFEANCRSAKGRFDKCMMPVPGLVLWWEMRRIQVCIYFSEALDWVKNLVRFL